MFCPVNQTPDGVSTRQTEREQSTLSVTHLAMASVRKMSQRVFSHMELHAVSVCREGAELPFLTGACELRQVLCRQASPQCCVRVCTPHRHHPGLWNVPLSSPAQTCCDNEHEASSLVFCARGVWNSCDSCEGVQVWVRTRPSNTQHPADRSGVKGKNPQQVPVKPGSVCIQTVADPGCALLRRSMNHLDGLTSLHGNELDAALCKKTL
ncbi:hypothetical protein EYF80_007141 [Liparis tanakae]|uniref:Uncharacterized protein n=1 Tax=Liparis tanakae TaxID=230148 RepID=A0A4Z2IZJ2_9TELE|nr:hypothetical protein EYF80_007141 [Liparis tanakae]